MCFSIVFPGVSYHSPTIYRRPASGEVIFGDFVPGKQSKQRSVAHTYLRCIVQDSRMSRSNSGHNLLFVTDFSDTTNASGGFFACYCVFSFVTI